MKPREKSKDKGMIGVHLERYLKKNNLESKDAGENHAAICQTHEGILTNKTDDYDGDGDDDSNEEWNAGMYDVGDLSKGKYSKKALRAAKRMNDQ